MWVTPNTVMTEVIFLSNVVDHCHGYLSLPSRVVVTIKATHVHTHTQGTSPRPQLCCHDYPANFLQPDSSCTALNFWSESGSGPAV